ncbi:hypothetical protein Desor_3977 [Desulfosporosinus orientis DSM 765]|uniref:Uncharacterized protein n=1 Tax=Desulfosporosinus orientis (strain ATCC 19365 / DSM 765 / NCIMB 8382 / VKM B-1628 / Singapore I) TaxID=768706 RepID=G7WE23_DESOD|nr:hypothetical protein [Desulfosporosinus orientis]AET69421.1 hypothetical protein Desor_3977 [Desulfosporosinus orientis DSM 765]
MRISKFVSADEFDLEPRGAPSGDLGRIALAVIAKLKLEVFINIIKSSAKSPFP